MHKYRIFAVMTTVFLIFLIGCSNTFSKKSNEAPDFLQNFINSQNVKEISFQASYETNAGFQTEDCKVIVDKTKIRDIINKVNKQKFVRFDLFDLKNNKSVFDNSTIKMLKKEKLNGIDLKIKFDKPMFENGYLILSSSTTSSGVDFSAKTTNRGYDTVYVCSDREFIIQIFNEAVN